MNQCQTRRRPEGNVDDPKQNRKNVPKIVDLFSGVKCDNLKNYSFYYWTVGLALRNLVLPFFYIFVLSVETFVQYLWNMLCLNYIFIFAYTFMNMFWSFLIMHAKFHQNRSRGSGVISRDRQTTHNVLYY